MKVLIVEPGQYPREAEIEKSLAAEQAIVGGLIECVYPWEDSACIVCNDEGKLEGLPLNRALEDCDVIAGTFFVVGLTQDDFCSLSDEQVERYKELFLKPQLFVPCRGGLIRVPYSNLNLPNTPDSIKQEFEVRHGLPELCFWSVEGLDRVILIQYGKSGYLPIAPPEGISAETFAEKLNSEMGVTKEQQQSMLCESPMRWDTLAKRLSRSDKRAPQHPHKQDEDKER